YRENVLQAQRKLTHILSQEDSMGKLLESAEQTLNYWREQYDRYQEKKQLQTKRRFLERELGWAEVARREETLRQLEANRKKEHETLTQIEEEEKSVKNNLQDHNEESGKLRNGWKALIDERLSLEPK